MDVDEETPVPAPRKEPKTRHPALKGWPAGVWNPEAVGKLPGYPKTQATFDARNVVLRANSARARAKGLLNRHGVPNGWAGKRAEVAEKRRNSQNAAERLMAEEPFAGIADCWEARLALTNVYALAINPLVPVRQRLVALRTFLTFTVPRPVARRVLEGAGGELEFLRLLADRAKPA